MMKKILTACFQHETNSFAPVPTGPAQFYNHSYSAGEESLSVRRGTGTATGGFLQVMDQQPDIRLIPSVGTVASPAGPVTAEAYDLFCGMILDTARNNAPLDGVFLDLHGAMVAEGHADGEGDLLEALRALTGPVCPIVVTLDLHANVTEKMARCATALIPCENYPHTDNHLSGIKAAQLMLDCLSGFCKPTMAYRRIPHLLPLFPTEKPEMQALYQKAHELESRTGAMLIRFSHGFFAADIEEMGMAVMTITDNDQPLAEAAAEEMASFIREALPRLTRSFPSLDEALDRAILPGEGPVVLADSSDNTGAGGPGDSTHILRRILERGITGGALAIIVDPASAAVCHRAGAGTEVRLQLGGWTDPRFSGGPLDVTARIRSLSDGVYIQRGPVGTGACGRMGPTAVVEIAGNLVIIASQPKQPFDLEVFRSQGIEPTQQKFLVVKSSVHYQASFGTIAREMIPLALPGYAPPTPDVLTFRNWNQPV